MTHWKTCLMLKANTMKQNGKNGTKWKKWNKIEQNGAKLIKIETKGEMEKMNKIE